MPQNFLSSRKAFFWLLSFFLLCSSAFSQTLQKEFNAISIAANKEKPQKLKIKKQYISKFDHWWFNGHTYDYYLTDFGEPDFFYLSNEEPEAFLLESLLIKRVDKNRKTPYTFHLKIYNTKNWNESLDSIVMYYNLTGSNEREIVVENELRKIPDQLIYEDTLYPQDIGKRFLLKNLLELPKNGVYIQVIMLKNNRPNIEYIEHKNYISTIRSCFFKCRKVKRCENLSLHKMYNKNKIVCYYLNQNIHIIDFHFEGYPIKP